MRAETEGLVEISLIVNGHAVRGVGEPRTLLADFLRENLQLTGTKLGCEHGVCGACTVLLEGEAVRSCLMFAIQADGSHVETIEGLSGAGRLHPVQEALREHHGLQCGFCTPGFVMSSVCLIREHPTPSEEEVRSGLAGNLCRCTGYLGILEAVRAVTGSFRSDSLDD